MTTLTLRGDAAEIRWGYQPAVTIGRWTLTIDHGTPEAPRLRRAFQGALSATNDLAVRQRPLTLIIPRPQGAWRWPVLALTVTDTGVVAELGAKEEV